MIMSKGCFITFEGMDGSGKSTQINKLQEMLRNEGYQVLLTREPGGTSIGEKVRQILLDPDNSAMDDVTEAYLYAASRAQLVREVIQPAVHEGIIVICDRFVDSSIAYQGYGRQMGDEIRKLNALAVGDCMPDLTILLMMEPAKGHSRIAGRELDRIELQSDSFHQRTYAGYEALSKEDPERIVVIDAGAPIDEIHSIIAARVKTYLENKKA